MPQNPNFQTFELRLPYSLNKGSTQEESEDLLQECLAIFVDKLRNGSYVFQEGAKGAVIVTIYALKLNSDWQSKLSTFESSKTNGTYSTYQGAYSEAKSFQDSRGLRNVCVGIVAASTLLDVYLFIRKPKTQEPKISVLPSQQNVGLALTYRF